MDIPSVAAMRQMWRGLLRVAWEYSSGAPAFFCSTKYDDNRNALIDLFRNGCALSVASISLSCAFAPPVKGSRRSAAAQVPSDCFAAEGYSMEARNGAGGS